MAITQEIVKYLNKLTYNDDGNYNTVFYIICKKFYYRERLDLKEMLYITALNEEMKNNLFRYINLCNPDNKDL